MDYTHFRWVVVDKYTDESKGRTVTGKNATEASRKLRQGEKLGSKIGGMNIK